ncbi:MAG: type II CAAX endopeptidase family protein [Saprospiraceae bacterium]|nr:type II CAAX endopeptidase family protein [Saprospiraceae bacterium]
MFFKKATSGDNNVLWYLLGIFVVVVGYILGQLPMVLVSMFKVRADKSITTEQVDKFYETMDFSLLNMNKNFGLILMIMVFVFAMMAFMLAIKHFHKRPFKNLITPKSTIDFKKIYFAFGFWFVLALVSEGIVALVYPETYYFNFKPMSWIILLIICILLLPIQTSFEELFIRGYLMPAISLITHNKWIPLVVTSIIFGLIHSMNPEVEKFGFWVMQPYYVGAGLFLGLITILDDSLELALGVHAATNIFGAAFFSFDGSVLQTDTIVKCSEIDPLIMSAAFLISAVIFTLVCSKKYKWNGLTRLFQKIGEEENSIVHS